MRYFKYIFIPVLIFIFTACSLYRTNVFETSTSVPDIDIKIETLSLPDETGSYSFGTVDVYTTKSATFTIENMGALTLKIESLYFLEDNISQFQLDVSSMSSVLEPDESTVFTIKFKPISTDISYATLIIKSNDPDEDVYSIKIEGEGSGAGGVSPDINIKQGPLDIPDGSGIYNYGTIEVWTTSSVQFTIENIGTAELYISDISLDSGNTDQFSIIAPEIPCAIAPGDSSTFTIKFSPTNSLYYSAAVKVLNDDPDEGSYTFTVDGTGSDTPVPDILVKHGSLEIPNQTGSHYFGWVEIGNSDSAIFTIENIGTDTLNITGISVIDVISNPGEFTVSPTSFTVIPGVSQSITVTFLPVSTGDREAEISIDSNDPDEAPYLFTVIGTGVAVGTLIPDIYVENDETGNEIPDGSIGHDFVDVLVGTSSSVTIIIENTGTGALNLTGPISIVDGDILDFSIDDSLLSTYLAPGGSTNFDIIFSPASTGNKKVTIAIPNDDQDENPYSITVIGKGTLSSEPEISIFVETIEYLHGSTYNFGTIGVGNSVLTEFIIQNIGTADLHINSILFVEGQAGDFLHDLQMPLTVYTGNKETFSVTFSPTATGIRGTRMEISNDDSDENPYKITLKGTGL